MTPSQLKVSSRARCHQRLVVRGFDSSTDTTSKASCSCLAVIGSLRFGEGDCSRRRVRLSRRTERIGVSDSKQVRFHHGDHGGPSAASPQPKYFGQFTAETLRTQSSDKKIVQKTNNPVSAISVPPWCVFQDLRKPQLNPVGLRAFVSFVVIVPFRLKRNED